MAKVLIVPGLAKAGTTFVYDQAAMQPDLFTVPEVKELSFFCAQDFRSKGKREYESCFPLLDDRKWCVDASPLYMESRQPVAERMRKVLNPEDVRMLVLLRDPVSAFYSRYLHSLKRFTKILGRLQDPPSFSIYNQHVIRILVRSRVPRLQDLIDAFGENIMGLHMRTIISGEGHTHVSRLLGDEVAPFRTDAVSNPGGFVPHCVYGGESGAEYFQDGMIFQVPPRTMLIVADSKSRVVPNVAPEVAALQTQFFSTFTQSCSIPREVFTPLIEEYQAMCELLGLTPEPISDNEFYELSARKARISAQSLSALPSLGSIADRSSEAFKGA